MKKLVYLMFLVILGLPCIVHSQSAASSPQTLQSKASAAPATDNLIGSILHVEKIPTPPERGMLMLGKQVSISRKVSLHRLIRILEQNGDTIAFHVENKKYKLETTPSTTFADVPTSGNPNSDREPDKIYLYFGDAHKYRIKGVLSRNSIIAESVEAISISNLTPAKQKLPRGQPK